MLELYVICSIFIFGIVFGSIAKKFKFPEVTGYLIAGIIMGPCVLKVLNSTMIYTMDIFQTLALSFISFMIGAEFKFKYIKKLGKKPFIIGIMSSLLTLFLVSVTLLLLNCSFPFSLVMGAIASSTAPAAIMMIVKEYKAKGEVTNNMLSVIAIDDVISLLLFGFAIAIAEIFKAPSLNLSLFLLPFKEILIAIVIGILLGVLLGYLVKIFKTHLNAICLIIVIIFGIILICDVYDISPLLMCMITGISFVNSFNSRVTDNILFTMDEMSAPFLVIFFVISGASLDFSKMTSCLIITIAFILARTVGKIFGAYMGADLTHCNKKIKTYLGPTLLSQTGLAIGLAIEASKVFLESNTMMTIIIASSFVFDMIGPVLTKYMLKKCGDIK